MFLTLRCAECGKWPCDRAREYIPEGSLEGCTREVTEEQSEEFSHYLSEVLPFLARRRRTDATDAEFCRIEDLLQHIYSCPFGRKLDAAGRVVS